METWHIWVQVIALATFAYFYFKRKFSYWAERGVKGPTPYTPFGNILDFMLHGQVKIEREWASKYGKVYGIYQGGRPHLTICDHELVKQVLVKDFPNFVNREIPRFEHEIFALNLFNSEDEQWRRIRAITSPSFTTGKLRGMNQMMNKCIKKFANYFETNIRENNGEFNIKQVATGFTIDVIALTSFATETNMTDYDPKTNKFLEHGSKIFDFSWENATRLFSFFTLPLWLNKLFGNSIGFNLRRFNFFIDMSRAIIRQRTNNPNHSKRNDLVQLMMDAFIHENELNETNYEKLTASADHDENEVESSNSTANESIKKKLTEKEIVAQCFLFFVAGFETTATTISNTLYLLALNPEVQTKLRETLESDLEGIETDSDKYFEKVTNQSPYLEAVMKETLRMCPPVTRLQRRVGVENYKLAGIPLEKDTTIEIGAYAIHYNPDYYPEPERFNPDRFLPENKHLLVPYTYLPFGAGPRNCIGMRFAYQEIKLCLAKLIREFKFSPTPKTMIPLNYSRIGILSCNNIPLKVEKVN